MGNRIIIGSGGCGFLRANSLVLASGMPVKFKGGRVKYQNSFETWNPATGLIWNTEHLTQENKIFRAKNFLNELEGHVGIAHYPLQYTKELIALDPSIKIVCLKGEKEHSVKSLFAHWAYRNPVATKRNEYRTRYVLEQFPDHSELDYYEAIAKYWEEYYSIAHQFETLFPNNFLVLNSKSLFDPSYDNFQTRKLFSNFFNNEKFLSAPSYPVDYNSEVNTVTLHGGLGNNLFQMAEAVAFCSQYNLLKPIFGTWKLMGGGGLFPVTYNADAFLGKHTGTHDDFVKTFANVTWQKEIVPTYDIKFMINDMFDFSRVHHMRNKIIDAFKPSNEVVQYIEEKYGYLYSKQTISLHLRTCTLPADDHVNGVIPFEFHKNILSSFTSDDMNVLVFSDNNQIAASYIEELKKISNKNFVLINENQFKSLFMIAACSHHIMHVSTFSFWGAYLDNRQLGKTFYHENFNKCHTDRMIPKELGWIKIS